MEIEFRISRRCDILSKKRESLENKIEKAKKELKELKDKVKAKELEIGGYAYDLKNLRED